MKTLTEILENSVAGEIALISLEKWFEVFEDLDKEEGRAGRILKYRVQNKNDAIKLSKNLGVYGANGHIKEVNYLQIVLIDKDKLETTFKVSYDDTVEFKDSKKLNLISAALAKLTPDELEVIRK